MSAPARPMQMYAPRPLAPARRALALTTARRARSADGVAQPRQRRRARPLRPATRAPGDGAAEEGPVQHAAVRGRLLRAAGRRAGRRVPAPARRIRLECGGRAAPAPHCTARALTPSRAARRRPSAAARVRPRRIVARGGGLLSHRHRRRSRLRAGPQCDLPWCAAPPSPPEQQRTVQRRTLRMTLKNTAGRRGIFTTAEGLTIAYLSGTYQPELFEREPTDAAEVRSDARRRRARSRAAADPAVAQHRSAYCRKDIDALVTTARRTAADGVDILLTHEWPYGVAGSALASSSVLARGVQPLAGVVRELRPRYHFAALATRYFERAPFRTGPPRSGGPSGHVTRFVALAAVGNAENAKVGDASLPLRSPLAGLAQLSWRRVCLDQRCGRRNGGSSMGQLTCGRRPARWRRCSGFMQSTSRPCDRWRRSTCRRSHWTQPTARSAARSTSRLPARHERPLPVTSSVPTLRRATVASRVRKGVPTARMTGAMAGSARNGRECQQRRPRSRRHRAGSACLRRLSRSI